LLGEVNYDEVVLREIGNAELQIVKLNQQAELLSGKYKFNQSRPYDVQVKLDQSNAIMGFRAHESYKNELNDDFECYREEFEFENIALSGFQFSLYCFLTIVCSC
jgi:hypothetical protein